MSDAAQSKVTVDGLAPAAGALGRTEDVAFTTDGRWLLAAGYAEQSIWAFEVLASDEMLRLGPPRRLASKRLAGPHGLAGIARTPSGSLIAVANRARTLSFHLLTDDGHLTDLDIVEPDVAMPALARAPSVVCAAPRRGDTVDLYSCSNDIPVLRHTTLKVQGDSLEIIDDRAFELPLVAVPDGLAVSPDGGWLALSNHRYHRVNLYSLDTPLTEGRTPDGIVSGMAFPHGLQFAPHEPLLLVADAGAPYVHAIDGSRGWRGMHTVARSVRVMDQATFLARHDNPQEGGPKGLEIAPGGATFVVTSHEQPLAAFALSWQERDRERELAEWSADRERIEFEEWFATGVTNAWLENEIRMLREIVAAWNNTKLVRWTRPLRAHYARLRRRPLPPH